MDINEIRNDFPVLSTSVNGKHPVYFDNACMSLKPRPVIEAMRKYYETLSACGAGRSNHALAGEVNRLCDQSRRSIATFIGARRKEEIIFTRNTTEAINLIAASLKFNAGDVVVATDKEHNSNLVPWLRQVHDKEIVRRVVPSREDNTFDMNAFERLLDRNVKLVSMGYTSNLDGVTIPVKEIIIKAHSVGALVLLDAAQAAAHHALNVADLDVDFLAFSGHKLFGPTGTGVLYGKYDLLEQLDAFLVGGDTVEWTTYDTYKLLPPPEKFEAGLQDYAGVIGLGAAVEFVQRIGWDKIRAQEIKLNTIITDGIHSLRPVAIIGPADPILRGSIISFTIDGMDVHQAATMLEHMAGIMVRAGQHCVHSWFRARNIPASLRASLAFYNTEEEANLFVGSMKKIVSLL